MKDTTPSAESSPISKTQLKKLRKRAQVAEHKRQRKEREREARRAAATAAGRDWEAEQAAQRAAAGTSRRRRQRQEQWEAEKLPLAVQDSFQICVDCAFEEKLTAKEIASLAKQLRYCYAANKASPHPCLWAATSLVGQTLDVLHQQDNGYDAWTQRAYTGTEQSLEDYYNRQMKNVVYLTSDSEHTLQKLENDKIYVIGGIVDRNRLKGATLGRAQALGVATAKLPLDEELPSRMPSTPVLTCNHVFEILLKYRQYGNDWGRAFRDVLPSRKFSAPLIKSAAAAKPAAEEPPIAPPPQQEEDDWGLSMNFHLFAQHQAHPVYYYCSNRSSTDNQQQHRQQHSFQILCVEALTPLDMMHLGSGTHDATGHCVWTGAFLLIACREELLPNYFADRRVIELGCGTGIGGLSLLAPDDKHNNNSNHSTAASAAASFVAFTDSDPEALALCQRNCELNKLPRDCYSVLPLTWGEEPLPKDIIAKGPFDTVCATDVLYDIGLLPPLFQTAASCLVAHGGGTFVLAHVPRACYNSQNPPVDNLEEHIVERAQTYGFALERLLRPRDCSCWATGGVQPPESFPADALNRMSLQEMEEIGAAIFVFRKNNVSN